MQRLNLHPVELDRTLMILRVSIISEFVRRNCRRADVNDVSAAMIEAAPQASRCNRHMVPRWR